VSNPIPDFLRLILQEPADGWGRGAVPGRSSCRCRVPPAPTGKPYGTRGSPAAQPPPSGAATARAPPVRGSAPSSGFAPMKIPRRGGGMLVRAGRSAPTAPLVRGGFGPPAGTPSPGHGRRWAIALPITAQLRAPNAAPKFRAPSDSERGRVSVTRLSPGPGARFGTGTRAAGTGRGGEVAAEADQHPKVGSAPHAFNEFGD